MEKKRIYIVIGVVVVFVGLLAGAVVSLLSGTAPSDAAAMVRADKYSVSYEDGGSSLPASIRPYVSSLAVGERANGTGVIVLIFKNNATALETQVKNEIEQQSPALNTAIDGTVMTITGPETAFNSLSGLGG